MTTIKAIETRYKGYRFRSRLEARWAVFLDTLGIKYEYEKEGFELQDGTRYLPDFWLPLEMANRPDAGYWLEIKPVAPSDQELTSLTLLTRQSGHNGFLIAGNIGLGEFRVFKTICVRTMKSAENWLADCRSGSRRQSILFITNTAEPRHDDTGNIHPEDRAAVAIERDDHTNFEFPFCEMCHLISDQERRRGGFMDAYQAARSARFEHGETPS